MSKCKECENSREVVAYIGRDEITIPCPYCVDYSPIRGGE